MSFSDALKKAPQETKKPPVLPMGNVLFRVKRLALVPLRFDFGDIPKGTEHLEVLLIPVGGADEETKEAIEEAYGGDEEMLAKQVQRKRIFEDEMWRLYDMESETGFAYDCGVNPADYPTGEDIIGALKGQVCVGVVTHNVGGDGVVRANLGATAPVE